jgi:hypothetical protein
MLFEEFSSKTIVFKQKSPQRVIKNHQKGCEKIWVFNVILPYKKSLKTK